MLHKIAVIVACVATFAGVGHAQQTVSASPTPAVQTNALPGTNKFVADFNQHWTTARNLAIAVADAMPTDNYAFRPTPEEMSFGDLIVHITQANYGYCAFVADAKPPYVEPAAGAKIDKAVAVRQLGESFDYCAKTFAPLSELQLDQVHGPDDRRFATRDVMLGVLIHMSHHRGQAEVYLRLKGVKPPDYKW